MMTNKDIAVLVVDDEDGVRLSLRAYLRQKGFTVYVASDGVGAIKVILDKKIDIVVTDYRMDIFGGEYWIRFLKNFCSNLKVIVVSAYIHPDFDMPFEVIFKPFEYEELYTRINTVLG